MDYNRNFRKSFHGKQDAWQRYVDNVESANVQELYCATNSERNDRVVVDSLVYATYSQDLDLWRRFMPVPAELHSQTHLDELAFVLELSLKRDEAIASQPSSYPIGLREVSFFLEGHTQENFLPGVEYLTAQSELENIYRGFVPTTVQQYGSVGPIVTLRDGARFVRNDPAIHVWADTVVNKLLEEGVKVDESIFVKDYHPDVQFNFSVIGGIDIKHLYWETAKRMSRLSFRTKHRYQYPRPEQAAWDLGQPLVSQAFDRGAPYHGSFTAMHSAIYTALKELTVLIFDDLHVMSNGKTVEHNTEVLKSNGQHWRTAAGVHYLMDNFSIEPLAKALAERVIQEQRRAVSTVRP